MYYVLQERIQQLKPYIRNQKCAILVSYIIPGEWKR